MLDIFEDITLFWDDGTLKENHVKEVFGPNIETIRKDDFIQDIFKEWRDRDEKRYSNKLQKLLDKSKTW